jgi:hypothetical protein
MPVASGAHQTQRENLAMAEVDLNAQAVIAAGGSLSAQADIGTKVLAAIVLPAAWIAAAGGLTFQASVDGGATWGEVTTAAGAAYTVAYTAAGPATIGIDPTTLRGVSSIKVRSGTKAAPVNQTSTVTVTLITRLKF